MRWSSDGKHLYCFSGTELLFGDAGKKLESVLSAKSPIEKIVVRADGSELIVFSEHEVTFVTRRWSLWRFLPVKSLAWPALAPEQHPLFE